MTRNLLQKDYEFGIKCLWMILKLAYIYLYVITMKGHQFQKFRHTLDTKLRSIFEGQLLKFDP